MFGSIPSDLAEHLALRSRNELLALIEAAGLQVLGRLDARQTPATRCMRHAARK
jgi:hypothetical protein